MFQKSLIFLVIFLASVIQLTLIPQFFMSTLAPSIILVMVIFWTLHEGFERSLPRIILAGLILDLSYQWIIGLNILTLVIISFATSFLAKRFLVLQKTWRAVIIISLVALATLASNTIIYSIVKLYNYGKEIGVARINWEYSPIDLIILIISNVLLMTLIYWPMKKLENFLSLYTQRILNQNRVFGKR